MCLLLGDRIELSKEQRATHRHAAKEAEKDEPPGRGPGLGLVLKGCEAQGLTLDGPTRQRGAGKDQQLAAPPPLWQGVGDNCVRLDTVKYST